MLILFSCQEQAPPPFSLEEAALIPLPNEVHSSPASFSIGSTHSIGVNSENLLPLAEQIGQEWESVTGEALLISKDASELAIQLHLTNEEHLQAEAYRLEIGEQNILLISATEVGLYRAWQTLKQVLLLTPQNKHGKQHIPTGIIEDAPDYAYRGAMLDVARHFFSVAAVKRYIDQLALYKINFLHLHLSDDQGWRIEIKSWPKLTAIGGSTEVGGGEGGFYTQEDYKEIVAYAQKHFITIVPEIDMPGHTNSALASYAELNCNGKATELYTGTEVGFSTLCVDKKITYTFIDDVVREIASITPGPYFHIGGDESHATAKKAYKTFVNKVIPIVEKYEKKILGWDEIQLGDLPENVVVQYWAKAENALKGKSKGAKVLMSPAHYAYLDMQYDSLTPLGLHWAAYINVKKGYDWVPETLVKGIEKQDIIGIEAPLWSETITNSADLEYLAFPRLPGYAEIGWTAMEKRNWEDYKKRLVAHQTIFDRYKINYYPSSLIDWN